MSECNTCRMEDRIHRLEIEKDHNSKEHSNFYNLLKDRELAEQRHEITITEISKKLDKIDKTLEEMRSKPEKNVDKFYGAIISAIGSLVGTGIVAVVMYGVIQGM